MNDQLKFIVPGKPEYVGTVRIAIAQVAGHAGFDIEAIDDIKVAISEACTNIVRHSHQEEDFVYDVILDLEETKLTITVEDSGAGFVMEDYIEPSPGETNGNGLGIFIIKALMDEVDICSQLGQGTHISMTKYRQPREL